MTQIKLLDRTKQPLKHTPPFFSLPFVDGVKRRAKWTIAVLLLHFSQRYYRLLLQEEIFSPHKMACEF
jgi:hypothetical protein